MGATAGHAGRRGLALWAPGPRRVLPPRSGSQAGLRAGLTPQARAAEGAAAAGSTRRCKARSLGAALSTPLPLSGAQLPPPRDPRPSPAPGGERFSEASSLGGPGPGEQRLP